jgi:hypothetical protein
MRTSGFRMFLALAVISGCAAPGHLTEQQVLSAAEPAMKAKFPDGFETHRPYHAEFKDGAWWVHGTLPTNSVGGTPEAQVQDGSGKVLKIWHTQ